MSPAPSPLPARPRAVIDAHHHIWDLANDLPWLKAERIPFRYGDYSPICRNYLPADYRADTKAWPVTGSVYVEAEWARDKAALESLWVAAVATSPISGASPCPLAASAARAPSTAARAPALAAQRGTSGLDSAISRESRSTLGSIRRGSGLTGEPGSIMVFLTLFVRLG